MAIRGICFLYLNKNTLVSKEDIKKHVWQGECVGVNSILQLIYQIRLVIQGKGYRIVTVRNRGYILEVKGSIAKVAQN
ncbi:winged helix-turn-helix domain-containing protein [Shewanella algae]|uniref:winged helix-turn-helix domain-containing protein n=1 Tax=Shewanella algae TaxID=38313 RepID=UPI003BF94ED5